MNRIPRVLLIADHKWRDLAALALLKVILEDEHGVSVRIVNYDFWDAALLAFAPDVICPTTQTGPRERRMARVARASGTSAVVIPTEGAPISAKTMPIVACSHTDLSNVTAWLAWSDEVRAYMLEHTRLTADQVVTTGVNRFDFYVEPYRRLLMPRDVLDQRYGLMPGKPVVTWATNFTHAGFVHRDSGFIQRDWTERGLTKIDGFESARAFAEADLAALEEAQGFMLQAFKAFPDVNFLLKSHPAERRDMYMAYVQACRDSGARNVTLVSAEYIGNLLNSSAALVHRYCTTGMEAWLMGVPTLNLDLSTGHTDPAGGGAMGDAAAVDHSVSTASELTEGLRRYLGGAGPEPAQWAARHAVLTRWLHTLDGSATARQARVLADIARRHSTAPRRRPSAFGKELKGAVKRLAHMGLNTALGRSFDLPFKKPRQEAGIAVNALGYADRFTRQPDVERWCRQIREFRGAASSAPPNET